MYQTKSRSDLFEQPIFTTVKQPKDTFWDDENARPFHLSIPEHFQHKKVPQQQNTRRPSPSTRKQPRQPQADTYYQSQQRFASRQNTPYMYDRPYSTLYGFFVQNFYANWIEKELNFTMSKLSFLALIIGLFFLSSLLFITGFLIAVNVYNIGAPQIASVPQSINYPLPNLDGSMPQMGMPNMAASLPNVPRPDLMKVNPADQGMRMGDVVINEVERLPSKYAQLPTYAMPPMPESGAQYMMDQRAPINDHVPSQGRPVYNQNYAPPPPPVQNPYPVQQPYQRAPYQAPQPYQNAVQPPYGQQQVASPQPMPPAPYPGGYPQVQYQPYPQQAPRGYAPAPYPQGGGR